MKLEKNPFEGETTYGDYVSEQLQLSWKEWVKKILMKVNSLLTSFISTGGNSTSLTDSFLKRSKIIK